MRLCQLVLPLCLPLAAGLDQTRLLHMQQHGQFHWRIYFDLVNVEVSWYTSVVAANIDMKGHLEQHHPTCHSGPAWHCLGWNRQVLSLQDMT